MSGIKVIPQAFYDLIARIIPGGVAIVALMAACNLSAGQVINMLFGDSPELKGSTFVLVITFLACAYLLGHLISTIGDLLPIRALLSWSFSSFSKILADTRRSLCTDALRDRLDQLIKETVKENEPTNKATELEAIQKKETKPGLLARLAGLLSKKETKLKPGEGALYLWYDELRVHNPEVGGRLAKLRAEYHMRKRIAQVLFIALLLHLLLCALSATLFHGWGIVPKWYLITLGLLGFLISGRAGRRMAETFQRSVINHYLLLKGIASDPSTTAMKKPHALRVRLEDVKRDRLLFPADAAAKATGRKILVTKILPGMEEEAATDEWKPPVNSGKSPVHVMKDTEVAVFTNRVAQDRHCHKQGTEIYMVLEGKMLIEVENKDYTLSAGDMIVVNPGAFHQVKPDKTEFTCRVVTVNCGGESDKYTA